MKNYTYVVVKMDGEFPELFRQQTIDFATSYAGKLIADGNNHLVFVFTYRECDYLVTSFVEQVEMDKILKCEILQSK